jgi:predicted esterase YcpF (UPF0227 family)
VSTAWHSDQPFEFRREYIEQLRALQVARITRPERYFLIAATGDEVLSYRDMLAHYAGAPAGDRRQPYAARFADLVDDVLAFCLPAAR